MVRFDLAMATCKEGVGVPIPFGGPHKMIELVQKAEELGFWAVWGTDFITPTPFRAIPDKDPPNWYELLISLSYAAAVTTKIKLGTGVLMLPLRDTILLAKQVATLDQLSDGRFLFGIGLGTNREEFEYVRPRDGRIHRGQLMDEQLAALAALLAHDQSETSFQGKYLEFHGVKLNPKPIQEPLPVYAPGGNDAALRRLAKFCHGIMLPAHGIVGKLEEFKRYLDEESRDISEFDVIAEGQLRLASTKEKAIDEFRNSRLGYKRRQQDPDKLVRENWIGTPEEVTEKIIELKKCSLNHFFPLHIAAYSPEDLIEQYEYLAREVIPAVDAF